MRNCFGFSYLFMRFHLVFECREVTRSDCIFSTEHFYVYTKPCITIVTWLERRQPQLKHVRNSRAVHPNCRNETARSCLCRLPWRSPSCQVYIYTVTLPRIQIWRQIYYLYFIIQSTRIILYYLYFLTFISIHIIKQK